MRRLLSLIAVSSILPLAARPQAADATAAMPLSLAKAVEIAEAPSGALRLQMAAELKRQAAAQRSQALSALLPNVDAAYTVQSFTRNLNAFGISVPPAAAAVVPIPRFVGPISNHDWRATAGWSLMDWSSWQRYKAARRRAEAVTAEEQTARNQVRGAVIKSYNAALRSGQLVKTARQNLALAERLLKLAANQKTAGTATGMDMTRAEAQVSRERAALIEASEQQDRTRLDLLRMLNLPLDTDLELTGRLEFRPFDAPSATQALERAREHRPELKSQALREESSRLNASAVKWERLPSAQVFADYGVIGTAAGSGLPTRSVGVRVNVPLFDGGRRDARRAEAASLERQESIRGREVRQQVELEVRTALDALRTAEQLVNAAAAIERLAEAELDQAERRFREGVASGVEVTDAQTRLSRARESLVGALYRHHAARADFGMSIGEPSIAME